MKSGKKLLAAAVLLLGGGFAVRGDLERWVQHTPAGPSIAALFRSVSMPGGAVPILVPPREARPALTSLIAAAPRDAMLYRLRAQEAELALDFPAAEADWRAYAQNAAEKYSARIELADFYHRRARPRDELAALTAAASTPDNPLLPAERQRGWQSYERMAALTEQDALPQPVAEPVFRSWVVRYPKAPEAWRKLIEYLARNHQLAAAQTQIEAYGRAFHDELEPVRMRAMLEVYRGSPDAAMAVYDAAFQPLWPEEMRAAYFKLLQDHGQLREFSGRARAALARNPYDLNAASRLFHYYRSQNNAAAARRTLLEYRNTKESGRQTWTADELLTTAQLFELLPDVNEAARLYYALYNVPPSGAPHTEQALYRLAHLLLSAPDQPIEFGSGDLSFYKDIATVDSAPGVLNGILSLLLNFAGPGWEYEQQNQKSVAYFHRAAGSRLVTLLAQRFPQSEYLPVLRAELVYAYAAYGDDASVIRAGREYLAGFPKGESRVQVAMLVSGSLARTNRATEEFALYDQLLRELGAKASNVPIGSNPQPQPREVQSETEDGTVPQPGLVFGRPQTPPVPSGARSAEYVQVLDKYLSRLASTGRPLDALRVYRNEIDRNPNDPGLYQRLGEFVEQNRMSRDVEDVYTRAIAKFADRSWYHKLARWYLRNAEYRALEKISRDVIAVFSGDDLEHYMSDISSVAHPDAVLYRQLNVYAHERFPEDLVFVRNLITAYSGRQTPDAAAAERLLRQYWFYDPSLRTWLLQRLSQQGRLNAELAAVRAANPHIADGQLDQALQANPAAVQFVVEAEAWFSHFESAAPAARALSTAYPGRREFATNASSLYRSLAAYYPADTEIAVTLAGYEQQSDPRDPAILARMGDICADRELFGRARTFWERMPAAQPGKPESYLDAATVYWDYYRFDDALRQIAAARKKFGQPELYAYQAGAIYEGKRAYGGAVQEYLVGALSGDAEANNRLLTLLTRPQTRDMVDRATAAAFAANPSSHSVSLRISVLEALQRRPDLETLLRIRVEAEKTYSALSDLQETARRLGFDAIEERASQRMAVITNDPIDKMRLTLANARLLEGKKDLAGAGAVVDGLYRDHPMILGVVRAAVDFHKRHAEFLQAIAILTDASSHARADLASQFTLEAARVATSAGQTDRARALLTGLLTAEPLRPEYLAAMADTYLQVRDDAGFRDYQLDIIRRLKQSKLAPAERLDRITSIRRGLIPALDRMKDAAGAVDQYMEVVNSYPEDESLTKEAAAYAVAHNQAPRMVAFYRKTITDAPLDYRWPIVLARMETVTEDYPAAIADYERAMKARPDRADIVEAKARLEERLMRFDDAIRSYSRLYELAYHDPQYLLHVAELQARSGRNVEAVTALKTAIIGERKETAEADFDIAERLVGWHILPDAVKFAENGAKLAGADLFKPNDYIRNSQAATYAGIMARARRTGEVLSAVPSGIAPGQRVGSIVAQTYTPEEKAALEQSLRRAGRTPELQQLTTLAGLRELESQWLYDAMAGQPEGFSGQLIALQSRRGLYADLARRLEEYAARYRGRPAGGVALAEAAEAFRAEGDVESSMRVMQKALAQNELSGPLLERYLELLAAREPQTLLAVVRDNASADVRNRAVQAAIASGRTDLALSAVRTRGTALPAVWTRAYTALAGQYLDDHSPAVDAAFQAALDTRPIGERLRNPLKPDAVIVGSVWFYYGARYGDYLAAAKSDQAAGWQSASLEASPTDPDAYMRLGDSFAEAGQGAKAIAQFEKALQLDPDRADAHSHVARQLWSEGRLPEAIARWKAAIATFLRIQSRGVAVPEPFWGRAEETFLDIGKRKAMDQLHQDIAHLLGDYYQRNNEYRLDSLINAAARASIESGQGIDWLMDLGRSMNDPQLVISALLQVPGVSTAQSISLQRDLVAFSARRAEASFGDARAQLLGQAASVRLGLVWLLLEAGDLKAASAEWSLTSDSYVDRSATEIRLASLTGSLDALLARYRSHPESAPSTDVLRNAAYTLQHSNKEAASAILEFLYERELHDGRLVAANFLGLAEARLQRNDPASALALLNRMSLVVDDAFEALVPAAELLSQYGRTADSADFIRRRVKAVPWDAEARLKLARTLAPGSAERGRLLTQVVTDSQASYTLRADAARLSATGAASGTELALLATGAVTADAATKPHQVEARVDAAHSASNPDEKLRLWMQALAIAPDDARVRTGATLAALALRRDNLALALDQPERQQNQYNYGRPSTPARDEAGDREAAALAEALAGAAERIDDLATARNYLQTAIGLLPTDRQEPLKRRVEALSVELMRRATNAGRQPAVKNVIEQTHVVRPQIARSAK